MTLRAIYGTAYRDDHQPDANIRQYQSGDGRWWTGHDTTDIDYFCGDACLIPHLPDDHGGWLNRQGTYGSYVHTPGIVVDGRHQVTTIDVESVLGDWPDYSVYCANCGDLIHQGGED